MSALGHRGDLFPSPAMIPKKSAPSSFPRRLFCVFLCDPVFGPWVVEKVSFFSFGADNPRFVLVPFSEARSEYDKNRKKKMAKKERKGKIKKKERKKVCGWGCSRQRGTESRGALRGQLTAQEFGPARSDRRIDVDAPQGGRFDEAL